MPRVKRTPVATTDDWQQRDLLVRSPEQRVYALIRPIVLFGFPPAARARGAVRTRAWRIAQLVRQPRRHDAAFRDGAIGCGDA